VWVVEGMLATTTYATVPFGAARSMSADWRGYRKRPVQTHSDHSVLALVNRRAGPQRYRPHD
jgi:hypothetical protein